MVEPTSWTCKVCGRHATIGGADQADGRVNLITTTSKEDRRAVSIFCQVQRCPNASCREFHVAVSAVWSEYTFNPHGADRFAPKFDSPVGVGRFTFLPTTSSPLSASVPPVVQEDYVEAHLILRLSPKSAATLARRALQGMVRDFWKVSMSTLHQELLSIKDLCAPDLYQAMMDVKSLGNIGAHPERDISLIIDIDAGEAEQLLELIHLLDQEWYVARAEKEARLDRLRALAASKDAARKG